MIPDGVSNQPYHRVAVDFLHNVGAMSVRRLGAYIQGDTDLLAAVPFGQ